MRDGRWNSGLSKRNETFVTTSEEKQLEKFLRGDETRRCFTKVFCLVVVVGAYQIIDVSQNPSQLV